ncbi:MAG: DUF1810 domain-containing protein [Proteobacteria bacterium]|nr:DUF1810 domain-containing protein [Pseudomonadota bacterium]
MPHAFDLQRFLQAQEGVYAQALGELKAGRKRTHWIWFIFPQLQGLGFSAMSQAYAISGLDEARAYLDHPVLGARLLECVQAMLAHAGLPAAGILGEIDAVKWRSCLTLFAAAWPGEPVFDEALRRFFAGVPDARTLELLQSRR